MIRADARSTLGLILMLVGLGLIGATAKAAFHPPPPMRAGNFDPTVYVAPAIQPPLRCPLRFMVTEPLDLGGDVWIFAVPSDCAST